MGKPITAEQQAILDRITPDAVLHIHAIRDRLVEATGWSQTVIDITLLCQLTLGVEPEDLPDTKEAFLELVRREYGYDGPD